MKRLEPFHFWYRGIDSSDMGVLCTGMPTRQQPPPNGERIKLPGRNGFEWREDGGYDAITIKLPVAIPNNADLGDACAWLSGAGELVFSDEPELAYDAMILTAYNLESQFKRLEGRKATITWTAQPFKHLLQEQPIALTSGAVFAGQGHEEALPLLMVCGDGRQTLTINQRDLLLELTDGVPLYIDCDAGTAYTVDDGRYLFAGERVSVLDDWCALLPGENNVNFTSGVSELVITPRWRFR